MLVTLVKKTINELEGLKFKRAVNYPAPEADNILKKAAEIDLKSAQ